MLADMFSKSRKAEAPTPPNGQVETRDTNARLNYGVLMMMMRVMLPGVGTSCLASQRGEVRSERPRRCSGNCGLQFDARSN